MDRTNELKTDYAAMQQIAERFQQRLTLKVEPKENCRFYLFEKEGRDSWIEQYNPEMYEYMRLQWVEKKGWTITPIDVFRTS